MKYSCLVFALTANGNSFAENAKQAGNVTLVGMVAIFSVLAILWALIEVLHRVVAVITKPKMKKQRAAEQNVPVADPVPAEKTPAADTDDGAIIAAITAAITASLAQEGYTGGFRVVSFKRASAQKSGRH